EFPGDFGVTFDRHIPLMDGGIYDNQGIESLLLVQSRETELDAIIVSDADVSGPPMYEPPRRRSFGVIPVWAIALAALALEIAAVTTATMSRDVLAKIVGASTAVLVGLLIAFAVRLKQWPIANRPRPLLWKHILRLTLTELVGAIETRAASLIALTSRVFMKRVRSLTYRRLFERTATSHIAIGNLISDLMNDRDASDDMQRIGLFAASTPTTLWFDDEMHLREIIAAGRMTTCRSLLRHMGRNGGPAALRERCEAEWSEFHRDPMNGV
ncbi:MAG TPA: hypothetical protein VLU46_12940, partial [Thermoanaerobaculia bacterium]|nr:hypothetical protein [Thermoanaerobaculia bacterium]